MSRRPVRRPTTWCGTPLPDSGSAWSGWNSSRHQIAEVFRDADAAHATPATAGASSAPYATQDGGAHDVA